MPSILPQSIFDLLKITNTGWVAFTVDPNLVVVTGNGGSNDMLLGLNNLGLNLNATVSGGGGNDRIDASGLGGLAALVPHVLNGGDGSDQIFGGGGLDVINGDDGNDYIVGGAGADTLSGGAHDFLGGDTLSYEFSNSGVNVNMAQVTLGLIAVSGGHATGDLVSNDFENVVGSGNEDTITGNGSKNILIGLGGNDTFKGGGGDDTIIGGPGADTFLYQAASDSTSNSTDALYLDGSDIIDLSQIDANSNTPANEAFQLNGSGAGSLRTVSRGGHGGGVSVHFIEAEINGRPGVDMVIRFEGVDMPNFIL